MSGRAERMTLLVPTLLSLAATPGRTARAAGRPNVFVDAGEIAAIKARIQAGEAPWRAAYDKVISAANSAKGKGYSSMPTIADNGGYGGDAHLYKTDRPYSSDGVFDPNADRTDYTDAIAAGAAVRDLGLAYAFTGDASYADKAVEYIRKWCLDPATYMKPQFTDGQSKIEICITIPGLFYGADLIYDYSGWSSSARAAFETWVADITERARGWSSSNNFENWRINLIATGGAFLHDSGHLTYAFDRFKLKVADQMNTTGQMIKELGRTNSLSYSTYAVNAMVQTAEVARHRGVDLYGHKLGDGRGLKLALDYHAPYVANPSSWPRQQITAYKGDNAALYEPAYSRFRESAYLSAITKWGRPMKEIRIMGWNTLTHGNLFELGSTPPPPPPPPPPPDNDPPEVSFAAPADGDAFPAGSDVYVKVDASDADGSVSNVKLYLNNTLVRQENSSPYEWGGGAAAGLDPLLEGMEAGSYVLKAVVTDDDGATGQVAVTITVGDAPPPSNGAPSAAFALPADGGTYPADSDIYVKVNASDPDGSVSNVRLYLNGTLVRQENIDPYEWGAPDQDDPLLGNMRPGSYTLRAVATDDDGAEGEATITVTVVEPAFEDTDADGLPDEWETEYFSYLDQGPTDDPDDDGYTNLEEYRAGTDPNDALSAPTGGFGTGLSCAAAPASGQAAALCLFVAACAAMVRPRSSRSKQCVCRP